MIDDEVFILRSTTLRPSRRFRKAKALRVKGFASRRIDGVKDSNTHIKDSRAITDISPELQDKLDAAAFRRLVSHLQNRTDVQNIDLMILADFCRNCLGDWQREAAEAEGV